jgi:hypothetical protein
MNLDITIRLTEIMLSLALFQQSLEHLHTDREARPLFLTRAGLSLLLLAGFQPQWTSLALLVSGLIVLKRFQGPYNGGSDRMSLLILSCLFLGYAVPAQAREYVFGYLAMQVILSYFIAGWVKIVNPEWRNGRALQDVFRFSAYPVSESFRTWAEWPRLLFMMSWAVMILEVMFPLTLISQAALIAGLAIASLFHLANACLFGLNRFFWIWLAAYPSILWLQHRIFG